MAEPTPLSIRPTEASDFVAARLYESEDAVIRDALRHLLRAHPEARLRVAAARYQSEELSLARAAELAGVSWAQMRDFLTEHGIPPRLGAESLEEARAEVETLQRFLRQDSAAPR